MSNSSSAVSQLKNIPLVGINLGSVANAGQIVPGEAGTHYQWPNRGTITTWVKNRGVRLIRFPFELQRAIQLSTLDGLPGQGANLNTDFVKRWKEMLGWIREDSNGEARIIPDPHHYMRLHRYETDANGNLTGRILPAAEAGNQNGWKATESVLIKDGNGVNGTFWSAVHLANFHQKLVTECDDPMVLGWGVGNEPYSNTTVGAKDYITFPALEALYISTMNTVLQALRNSSKKPVFICGLEFASARNWATVSANLQSKIVDPANAIVWEAHAYGDYDKSSSGAYANNNDLISPTVLRDEIVGPFLTYAKTNKMAAFIGETGIPPTAAGRTALKNLLDKAKAEKVPVTLWVTGPGTDGEKMSLEASNQAETVALVTPYFAERIALWGYAQA
ncbi:prophage PSPPH01, putative cellulase [Pseudomonas amygdali pv. mori str. 301020]|uniref:Prophage PSPPH01, putative cellulase n=1 Tax=Pseudomonas amygdali pv. mori str. 301020 TaxID=629261 RepID=A0A656GDR5_PSEA0|nr:prophage PSPPH01, putative cellulase [Pseudomonas amygdali pv. mori str. 301020]